MVAGRFPYQVGQTVAGNLPGPSLSNGTVTAVGELRRGFREVVVAFGPNAYTRCFRVTAAGACHNLLPEPVRPTVDDDRVTPNEAYTVDAGEDGRFVARFEGRPLGGFGSEAEGWTAALRHDHYARHAAMAGSSVS